MVIIDRCGMHGKSVKVLLVPWSLVNRSTIALCSQQSSNV